MKTGTRWAIPVVSYNRIYQTWSINGCLRYVIHKLKGNHAGYSAVHSAMYET